MSISSSRSLITPAKLLASAAAAALLIGLTAGIGAQAADPEQTSFPPLRPPAAAAPVPLGHDDIREVQNQLIALGFNPGPADGQIGPSTLTAVQQYDSNHGGNGQAQIDSAFLARLKADTGPRLSYEQVQQRAQTQTASAPAASSSGGAQFGSIVNQIVPLIGAAIANSNNNNNGYYGPGPGYYGPPPGYYGGYGYGGY